MIYDKDSAKLSGPNKEYQGKSRLALLIFIGYLNSEESFMQNIFEIHVVLVQRKCLLIFFPFKVFSFPWYSKCVKHIF